MWKGNYKNTIENMVSRKGQAGTQAGRPLSDEEKELVYRSLTANHSDLTFKNFPEETMKMTHVHYEKPNKKKRPQGKM